jgi:hypothetical protein
VTGAGDVLPSFPIHGAGSRITAPASHEEFVSRALNRRPSGPLPTLNAAINAERSGWPGSAPSVRQWIPHLARSECRRGAERVAPSGWRSADAAERMPPSGWRGALPKRWAPMRDANRDTVDLAGFRVGARRDGQAAALAAHVEPAR